MRRLTLLVLTLLTSTSCIRSHAGMLLTSNRPLSSPYTMQTARHRESCESYFLGIPVSRGLTLRELVDDVKGEADAVVDVTVDYRTKDYFVFAQLCYDVVGTPVSVVDTPPPVAAARPPPAPAPEPEPTSWQPDDRRRVSTLTPRSRRPVDVPADAKGGVCLVEVWMDASGTPEQVVPDAERCDETAAQAVVDSVMRWTFEQVQLEGEAVPVHFPLKVALE